MPNGSAFRPLRANGVSIANHSVNIAFVIHMILECYLRPPARAAGFFSPQAVRSTQPGGFRLQRGRVARFVAPWSAPCRRSCGPSPHILNSIVLRSATRQIERLEGGMMRVAIVNIGTIVSGDLADPFADGDTIVTEDDRILTVGARRRAEVEACDVVIDADGTTAIPGPDRFARAHHVRRLHAAPEDGRLSWRATCTAASPPRSARPRCTCPAGRATPRG